MRVRCFLGLLPMVVACGFDEPPPLDQVIDSLQVQQLARWSAEKPTCRAYFYDRVAVGGGRMTVQMVDDQPLWRWFVVPGRPTDTGPRNPEQEWVERDEMVGFHADAPPARTVEALWDECATFVHAYRPLLGNLTTNELGVPMDCNVSYSAEGIFIRSFKCGRIAPPAVSVAQGLIMQPRARADGASTLSPYLD